ncbi:cyclic nucleotide-binding protein [Alsobacter soli]|uniref:Cyclic nucleotide-binding protein n=1 Tax=Alsobacter soli TaxID=2109933 RepID=A0A2T1HUV3_9HYPH|nr:Crp/Fnr family transcriptional regulator [Alsobacter soli]PSC05421.1 cyclic nucleotide-binding protein [Alsobacter soli]
MQTLARVPFFKDAGIDLDRFDRRCAWRKFDENEIVVDFEDPSTDVYFLLSGEVRVLIRTQAGKEIILAEMRGGQFFGELAAIDDVRRSANVTALTRAEMCIMPAGVFKELVFASPVVCDKLLRQLTARIRELNARITEHSVFDLKHRLYAELIRMSAPRMGVAGERVVSPPPFHHVLAARIGCRREQVTRELSALSGQGVIAKTRGALVIRQPQVLEHRIAEAMQADR